ncbi:MAG: KOW motif-containing protein [Acidilobaceae archaeon]|jgi:transcriptional antiterminator NusG
MEVAEVKSRFYAIHVVKGMEGRVALLLEERSKSMGLDVRSIVVPVDANGYLIVEVGNSGVLYHLTRGVRYVKRKRPVAVREEDALRLAKPVVEAPKVARGQLVEIIGGPFKGMKGRVVEVYEARRDVDVSLLDFRMVVTIPLELVKPIEQK